MIVLKYQDSTIHHWSFKDIKHVSIWFKVNKLALNLTKTNYIIFRTRNRRLPTNLPDVYIDNVVISRLQNVKFLGVLINENLDWSNHISSIYKCLARNVGILTKLKFTLPCNVLYMLYNSIVVPHLNYCNYIWGNTYKSHLTKINIIQKKAVRTISKSSWRFPSAPLFRQLNILPLHELIAFNTLIFMYCVHYRLLPEKYCNMFFVNSELHSYNTRQSHHFHQQKFRLTSSLNSISYTGVKEWNMLEDSIKSSTTITKFKKQCRTYLLESMPHVWKELTSSFRFPLLHTIIIQSCILVSFYVLLTIHFI